MDELAGLLESSFQVSNDQYSTSAIHPRYSQYKLKTATSSDQEIRRKRILQQQKQWVQLLRKFCNACNLLV